MNGRARNDLRSFAMHREAVRVLRERPEMAVRALEVLAWWQANADAQPNPLWDELAPHH